MQKIIFSIGLIFLFSVLVFAPLSKVEAIWTYVGLQLDSAKRISADTDFCLWQSTKMYVMSGVTELNVVTTADKTCANGTGDTTLVPDISTGTSGKIIWSRLVDLTDGNQYSLKLEVPLCFGYFRQNIGVNQPFHCWYRGYQTGGTGFGESCNEICADNDTTPIISCNNNKDQYCSASKDLFGISCTSCYVSTYGFNGKQNNDICFSNTSISGSYDCNWKSDTYALVCVCNYNTGTYSFPFTFTAP